MYKLVLEKAEEPEIKLPISAGSLKKQESSRKTSISALLTMPKPLTVWITIQEEDITIVNTFAPSIGALQFIRQILTSMKGEIISNTIIVGDFKIPLTLMDRSTKQKISKETQTLNDKMNQLDLIDISRHQVNLINSFEFMNFTLFSSAHRTFSRIDHILHHKSSLGKLKKIIEIISSIFSDHNEVRLDVNNRKKTIKNTNIQRLNNTLVNNQQIREEIKKEIRICIEDGNTTTQTMGSSKISAKAKVHSNTSLLQETRKKSNN